MLSYIILSVITLNVMFHSIERGFNAVRHFADLCHSECHKAESCHAELHYTECYYTECLVPFNRKRVIKLRAFMLSVIKPSVVILNVVAPSIEKGFLCCETFC
jgi:hypothetical protein